MPREKIQLVVPKGVDASKEINRAPAAAASFTSVEGVSTVRGGGRAMGPSMRNPLPAGGSAGGVRSPNILSNPGRGGELTIGDQMMDPNNSERMLTWNGTQWR